MQCHNIKCNKSASYVVTTKGRSLDREVVNGHVFCLKHGRLLFQGNLTLYGKDVVTRLWKVNVIASNREPPWFI